MPKKLQTILVALVAAGSSAAAASSGGSPPNDTHILQVALGLNYVVNAFHQQALEKFDESDFEDAGFAPWVRGRYEQIAAHDAVQAQAVASALGENGFPPCTYDFGSKLGDVRSFVEASARVAAVAASRALYAQQLYFAYQDVGNVIGAGTYLAIQSRHAAWINSAVLKREPWSGPYETPLSLVGAYSLVERYIVSCPETNPKLAVREGLPLLTFNTTVPYPGGFVEVQIEGDRDFTENAGPRYLAWLNGLGVKFTKVGRDTVAAVPSDLQGISYVALVSNNTDGDIDKYLRSTYLVVDFAFDSSAPNPGPSYN